MTTKKQQELSPAKKALHTAKWARTMTKWLVRYSSKVGARWNVVAFGGKTGSESRGIVDLMAIRKDHVTNVPELKRGDLFEVVLIQTKGGTAPRPTHEDVSRLSKVARHYGAEVVLAEWKKGKQPDLSKLKGKDWVHVEAANIFNKPSVK